MNKEKINVFNFHLTNACNYHCSYCFGKFQSKAKAAYEKAKEAIDDETKYPSFANSEWRDIYGNKFPLL